MVPSQAGSTAIALVAPAATTALVDATVGGIDLLLAVSILGGLFAGAVLRSGDRIDAKADRATIWRDLRVSATALMANFIITAIVVSIGTLALPVVPPLAAAGAGLFFGYMGRTSIQWFKTNVLRMREPPVENPAMQPVEDKDPAMEFMLRQLSEIKGPDDE